jgi:hypothetical protein
LLIEVKEDAFKVGFIENLFVFGKTEEEGGAADVVDEPGDAFGLFVKSGEESIGEELVLAGGEAELVFDVSESFLKVERGEGVADGNALVEGLVGGEAEFGVEVGLANEDEGEERIGIEIVVKEKTELVEDIGGEEMGFIDDEEGEAVFAGEGVEGIAELGEEAGESVGGFKLKREEDLGVEGGDVEVGVGEIDEGVEGLVEGMDESAQGG